MLIEIRRAGFLNKGAQLMLYAIVQQMKEAFPEAEFAMAPNLKSAPYHKRAEMQFLQKAHYWRRGRQWGNLARFLPDRARKMYGIVLNSQVDVVLDAAGFAYSEQLGVNGLRELADSCKRWKKNGTKVIFLPQAFGPFESSAAKRFMRTVVQAADLMYAREEASLNHLNAIAGKKPSIKLAPDFTNLTEGVKPDYFQRDKYRYCLIPNWRMVKDADDETSENYIAFMSRCAEYLQKKNGKPFILIHEGEQDKQLADKINESLDTKMEVLREDDPLKIKGIIGACAGTIGSRFHGLVSALSQGVPSIATGWSHKYQMLLQDYDYEEGITDVNLTDDELKAKLDMIIEPDSHADKRQRLMKKSYLLKEQSKKMWAEVIALIESQAK